MKFLTIVFSLLLFAIIPVPQSSASGCPSTELVFARGTMEAPGLGDVGQALAGALGIPAYAVDYPASMSFNESVLAGVSDIVGHIESCPGTRFVIGGYSQGAAVAAWVTSDTVPDGVDTNLHPLSGPVAARIRAVVLFAPPSAGFSQMLGVPMATVGGRFVGRTDTICAAGDPVCDSGSDFGVHSSYPANGSVDDAARFVRARL